MYFYWVLEFSDIVRVKNIFLNLLFQIQEFLSKYWKRLEFLENCTRIYMHYKALFLKQAIELTKTVITIPWNKYNDSHHGIIQYKQQIFSTTKKEKFEINQTKLSLYVAIQIQFLLV